MTLPNLKTTQVLSGFSFKAQIRVLSKSNSHKWSSIVNKPTVHGRFDICLFSRDNIKAEHPTTRPCRGGSDTQQEAGQEEVQKCSRQLPRPWGALQDRDVPAASLLHVWQLRQGLVISTSVAWSYLKVATTLLQSTKANIDIVFTNHKRNGRFLMQIPQQKVLASTEFRTCDLPTQISFDMQMHLPYKIWQFSLLHTDTTVKHIL